MSGSNGACCTPDPRADLIPLIEEDGFITVVATGGGPGHRT